MKYLCTITNCWAPNICISCKNTFYLALWFPSATSLDVKCNKIKVAKWYNTKNHYNSEAMLEKSICKSKHHTSTKPDGYWIVCFRLLKVGELQIECSWNPLESHKHIPLVRAVLLYTSHSAYDATSTESNGVKIDGFLYPNFM